jgi:orotidine-5'-phosphate decarboxylase
VAELVVAFDHANAREALDLADRLPGLAWAKVGPVLYVREGPALVREFARRGARVFLDLKWHDIPSTVAGAVAAARDHGVAMATVHCLGGPTMLEAAAVAAGGALALVGVTVLTSHDPADFGRVMGRATPDLGAEAARLTGYARNAGLRGVVASGHEAARVRAVWGDGGWIVVPGVRRPGDPAGDQARHVTPAAAVRAGATHLVVGRALARAADPVAVYQEILACM